MPAAIGRGGVRSESHVVGTASGREVCCQADSWVLQILICIFEAWIRSGVALRERYRVHRTKNPWLLRWQSDSQVAALLNAKACQGVLLQLYYLEVLDCTTILVSNRVYFKMLSTIQSFIYIG